MEPMMMKPKKNASLSYGLGVAKIVAGIPVILLGLIPLIFLLVNVAAANLGYILLGLLLTTVAACGGYLVYNGATACRLVSNYQRLTAAMQYKNREDVRHLAKLTGQSLTNLTRDLRKMADKGFFPSAYLDLNRSEFVLQRDNKPAPLLANGDVVLKEKIRPSMLPLAVLPVVFGAYGWLKPFTSWLDFVAAGALAIIACGALIYKLPKVHEIREEQFKALPAPEPAAISTGNDAMDDLLTNAMDYVGQLNELSLAITSPKMTAPVGELLNISRQIFIFVEKHPEKIRQIRQFMNYYLPTTIKLLTSYNDFSRQTSKGDNVKEAITKIEDSMEGIVETFKRELDNLYRDKATDISVDIDVMLAMMRQQGIAGDFVEKDK